MKSSSKVAAPVFDTGPASDEWTEFEKMTIELVTTDFNQDVSVKSSMKLMNAIFVKYGTEVTTDMIRTHMRDVYVQSVIQIFSLKDESKWKEILCESNVYGNAARDIILIWSYYSLAVGDFMNYFPETYAARDDSVLIADWRKQMDKLRIKYRRLSLIHISEPTRPY